MGTRGAAIDMNSLIDLTFLLLVVFIVTLPTLEQSIHVLLPVGEAPTTLDDLKTSLAKAVVDNPELSVLVRGDVRVGYGDVYEVVKIAKECNVKHLGLVSKEN